MTKQSKKAITITQVRKATEEELAALKPSPTDKYHAEWVIGIDHLSEFGSKARAFFPTHNFEVTKKYREDLFNSFYKPKALNERGIKGLRTTEKDLEDIRRLWLNDELKLVDKWMNIPHMSLSDRHELSKYQTAVNDELAGKGKITSPAAKPVTEKKESPKQAKQIGYQYFAFYQIITEKTPSMEPIRMPESSVDDKKDFAQRIFQELRGDTLFSGKSFYVEYRRLIRLYDDGMLLNEVNNPLNPEAKRRFKEYTFRIAEYFGNEDYKRWWGDTFTQ